MGFRERVRERVRRREGMQLYLLDRYKNTLFTWALFLKPFEKKIADIRH
jgi:hypothetical protein